MKARLITAAVLAITVVGIAGAQTIINIQPDPYHRRGWRVEPAPVLLTPTFELRPMAGVHDGAPVLIAVESIVAVSPHAWLVDVDEDGDGTYERQEHRYTTRVALAGGHIYYDEREWHELVPLLADAGWGEAPDPPLSRWTLPEGTPPAPSPTE